MTRAADSWDDPRGAEVYNDVVRRGRLYPELGRRLATLAVPAPPVHGSVPASAVRVLDLATGTGIVAGALLARLGPHGQVVGTDYAPAMLAVARCELPVHNVAFVRADNARLPFAAGSFDAVTCSAAFWHFPAPEAALTELARVVRPGGRLVYNVPAAQLAGADDLPPAPVQLALARLGRARTGTDPQPAGPRRSAADLHEAALRCGFTIAATHVADAAIAQSELIDLLEVPAIGARMFPDLDADGRAALVADAVRAVDPGQAVTVRWHEFAFVRTGAACALRP